MPKTKDKTEYERFESLTDALLSVPHGEIQKREAEYKQNAPKGAHKRGPKPKVTRRGK